MTLLLVDVRAISPFELLLNGAVETLVYRLWGLVCASTSLCYLLRNGMGRPCRHPVLVLGAFKLFSRASEPLTFFTSIYRSSVYPHHCVVLMLWSSSLCSVWAILFNVKWHFLADERLSWAAASFHYISSLEKHYFNFSTLGVFVCFRFDSVKPIPKAYLQFMVHLTLPHVLGLQMCPTPGPGYQDIACAGQSSTIRLYLQPSLCKCLNWLLVGYGWWW